MHRFRQSFCCRPSRLGSLGCAAAASDSCSSDASGCVAVLEDNDDGHPVWSNPEPANKSLMKLDLFSSLPCRSCWLAPPPSPHQATVATDCHHCPLPLLSSACASVGKSRAHRSGASQLCAQSVFESCQTMIGLDMVRVISALCPAPTFPTARVLCTPAENLSHRMRFQRRTKFPAAAMLAVMLVAAATCAHGQDHSCALSSSGAVSCWGYNEYGQVGDGTSGTNRLTPVGVAGLGSGVAMIALGGYHSCALSSSGAVSCWGYNYFGQVMLCCCF